MLSIEQQLKKIFLISFKIIGQFQFYLSQVRLSKMYDKQNIYFVLHAV